jgi:hypothetical protein
MSTEDGRNMNLDWDGVERTTVEVTFHFRNGGKHTAGPYEGEHSEIHSGQEVLRGEDGEYSPSGKRRTAIILWSGHEDPGERYGGPAFAMTPGRRAFEVYNGLSQYSDAWDKLPEEDQERWEAAAKAARGLV